MKGKYRKPRVHLKLERISHSLASGMLSSRGRYDFLSEMQFFSVRKVKQASQSHLFLSLPGPRAQKLK